MVLVLVTDESGDRQDNVQYIEAAIAEAKAARCKVYVLGREAVFGYPYGYIYWRHPPDATSPIGCESTAVPRRRLSSRCRPTASKHRHDALPQWVWIVRPNRALRSRPVVFFFLFAKRGVESSSWSEATLTSWKRCAVYTPDLRARVEIFLDRDKQSTPNVDFGESSTT